MEPINDTVASNLKSMREHRKLSLDALSKLTGVSRSMLSQIEKGEANPTISIVWKIANGLKVSFTELVTKSEMSCECVEKNDVPALFEDEGRYRNYPLFPCGEARKFEVYYIELDPGASFASDAHPAGTQEYVLVSSGEVEICVDGESLRANPDRFVRFRADRPHAYRSIGDEPCRLNMVISYSAPQ